MKNTKKMLALIAVLVMVLTGVFALVACTEPHVCGHVCETCQKCTDADCTDAACAEKCQGHTPVAHVCGHKCATCGKCTDATCTDAVCADKCQGHTGPVEHVCKHVCPTCNKCLDADCTDSVCSDKCKGHTGPVGHVCEHECAVCHKCTTDCEEPECSEKCDCEGYIITLVLGNGVLEDGVSTKYKTGADGKLQGYLPEPESSVAHYLFDNWYDAETAGAAIDEDVKVFTENTTIYARYIREDGIWLGDTFKHALSINGGSTDRTEYWLGGDKITLAKDDVMSIYIDGKIVSHYVEPNSAGVVKPDSAAQVTEVTVAVAGPFDIYLHKNATDWSCEYSGPTEVIIGSDIPEGCDAFRVNIGTNVITFYLVDNQGNAVGAADFSKFCIYTYNGEIFGAWADSTTKGKLSANMTGQGTAVPDGWIFRWGSGYTSQTANIVGVFKNGGTYVVELPASTSGDAKITEIAMTKSTVTIDLNYEGQPAEKATVEAVGGKLSALPTEPTRDDFDFAGWFTAAVEGEEVTLDTEYTEDTTIYAHWTAKIQITVNLNYDGCAENTIVKANKGKLSALPTAPAREGYYVIGWFTEAVDGEKVTVNTVYTEDTTIYAHWGIRVDATVTVNYNYDGCADPETIAISAANGNLIIPFPTAPVREGYEFLGWYTTAVDTEEVTGELVTEETEIHENTTIYARYAVVHTLTLVVGEDATLPEGAATTYKILDGKIQLPAGSTSLPTVTVTKANWKFMGWYNGTTAVNVATEVFEEDTTLTAKIVRADGVWVGDTFKAALSLNGGADRAEYWLGGAQITLQKGEKMSLYIDGELISHYVEPSSAGVTKPASDAQVTEVTVAVAGPFAIYLHKNAADWSCEYSGPTELNVATEIPEGCDAFKVTIGSNVITFYLVDSEGNAVGKADFGKFCIYTYEATIFGDWNTSTTKGVVQEAMTGAGAAIPNGWIFRWGSSYGSQTANIIGLFKNGKTYIVELPSESKGDARVSELNITKNTVTIDLNYEGQPEEKATMQVVGGKYTLPANPVRDDYDFAGWFTEAEDGTEITADYAIGEDITIYAHWTAKIQVTVNYNYEDSAEPAIVKANYGKLNPLPTATREGYYLIGWFTAAEEGDKITVNTVLEDGATIYAHWGVRVDATVTVNYNYEGCADPETISITAVNGNLIIPFPTAPEREGYKFLGWYTTAVDTEEEIGELVTAETEIHADTTIYARYAVVHTLTLVVDANGSLPAGAKTTYEILDGKIQFPEGVTALPTVTASNHWKFAGWYNGTTAVNVATAVFEEDTTLTAKIVRDDGVWKGETFVHSLTINAGSTSRTEYWLGGDKITLAKGDKISLYMNGTLVNHYVEPNSAGIVKPSESTVVGEVTVDVSGEMEIYLHRNASDWSCQYAGPTEVNMGSEIPYGCDAFTLTIGSLKPIRFFIIDGNGNPVTKADFGNYAIYTYDATLFGDWTASATKGIVKEEMTVTGSAVPKGFIFRWGSGYSTQTADIISAFAAGKTYLVELPKANKGTHKITELEITSIYTITLDQNYEGQPATKDTIKVYNGKPNYLPTFVRAGYEDKDLFWYTAAEGGEKVTLNTVFTADATIYARWSEKIKITPNYNYDDLENGAAITANLGKLSAMPANPTREGYEFLGWFTLAEGGERVTTDTVFEADSQIYAHWRVPFQITFDLNYTGSPEADKKTANVVAGETYSKLTSLGTNPTREGYEFLGWFSAAEDGDRITTATEYTGDTTIYAHWRVPFKVTFDYNYENSPEAKVENAAVVANQTYSKLTSAQITTPVREGYDFLGWYPNADGTGTKLTTSINITGDVTYYASWRLPVVVTFDLNYEDCAAATTQTATLATGYTYSKLTAAQITTPERTGYDFLGWYPNADGTGSKLTTSTQLTANVTYYASWRLPIVITFDLNYDGCTAATTAIATLQAGTINSQLTAAQITTPERTGYDFLGWYTTTAATGGTKLATTTNHTADTTYYARWREIIKVTLNLNYTGAADPTTVLATLYSASATAAYSRVTTLPADPVRDGYDFLGWYTTTAATGGTKLATTINHTADTTYYARWREIIKVTLNLNYDGAADPTVVLATLYSATASAAYSRVSATQIAAPVRTGYDFVGWYNTAAASGGSALTTSINLTANVTYYARWTAGKTVTFNLNYDGQPSPMATATTTNKLITLPDNPTREGYEFKGWFTTATGTTAVAATKTYTSNTTIYAQWTALPVVSFDLNDGEEHETNATLTVNAEKKLTAFITEPTREGYTFAGWFTAAEEGEQVTLEKVYTANTTVYAHWTAVEETPEAEA